MAAPALPRVTHHVARHLATTARKARFVELLRTPALVTALNDHLQVFSPNTIQAEALPRALNNEDILVSAQTGSGKTLCFLLPILDRLASKRAPDMRQARNKDEDEDADTEKKAKACPEALILVPSFELGRQTCAIAERLTRDLADPPRIVLLSNGNRFTPEKRALRSGSVRLIVATPARLLYHLKERSVVLNQVQQLAIDEVDLVLCADDDSRQSEVTALLRALRKRNDKRRRRQYILAGATISEENEVLISEHLTTTLHRVSHRGVLVPTMRQQFHFVRGDKEQELLRLLERCYANRWLREGATLVFCRSPSRAQRVHSCLLYTSPSPRDRQKSRMPSSA